MSVPSASVRALAGPAGGATTTYLPLIEGAPMGANAEAPGKYLPVPPVWTALLVSVVVSLSELGCTTFGLPKNMLSKYCTDLSDSALLTVALNLPLSPLK